MQKEPKIVRRKRNRQFLDDYLAGKLCCRCDNSATHFVVRDPTKRGMSELAHRPASLERIAEELPNCDLYCGKCVHGVRFRRTARRPGRSNNTRETLRNYIRSIKAQAQCAICPENEAIALDFHHRNPAEKDATIGNLVKSGSRKRIDLELAKCVIICANCHRKLHAGILSLPA